MPNVVRIGYERAGDVQIITGLLWGISMSSEDVMVASLLRLVFLIDFAVAVFVADEKKAFGSSMPSSSRSCSGTSSPVTLGANFSVSS